MHIILNKIWYSGIFRMFSYLILALVLVLSASMVSSEEDPSEACLEGVADFCPKNDSCKTFYNEVPIL
jgi:hypothetical protein